MAGVGVRNLRTTGLRNKGEKSSLKKRRRTILATKQERLFELWSVPGFNLPLPASLLSFSVRVEWIHGTVD
jgi:hypothetical protein